jgi:hypothetical protein
MPVDTSSTDGELMVWARRIYIKGQKKRKNSYSR